VVQVAVTPWGQIEVDGRAIGITPPLSRLSLPEGKHQIVVRNGDFPAFTTSITVSDDKPVTVRHRFE
jgi:serine/threonine-protein kinase